MDEFDDIKHPRTKLDNDNLRVALAAITDNDYVQTVLFGVLTDNVLWSACCKAVLDADVERMEGGEWDAGDDERQ